MEPLRKIIRPAAAVLETGVRTFAALLLALSLAGCGQKQDAPSAGAASAIVQYSYSIEHTWPHARDAFTEGLVFLDGALLESTGLNGQSSIRKVELTTGKVLKQVPLPPEYFGEGIAVLNGKIYQLTWRAGKAFVYDLDTFQQTGERSYEGEGWGLTTDGKSLIMSDGSDKIRYRDPATFAVTRTLNVTANGQPVGNLNELEYIKGEIFANVWKTEEVVRINPETGNVAGIIDFSGLLAPEDYLGRIDVFNGIAYDAASDRLFVTGKFWPKLFEVRLKRKQ
jgi:glutamine cyclotransferase